MTEQNDTDAAQEISFRGMGSKAAHERERAAHLEALARRVQPDLARTERQIVESHVHGRLDDTSMAGAGLDVGQGEIDHARYVSSLQRNGDQLATIVERAQQATMRDHQRSAAARGEAIRAGGVSRRAEGGLEQLARRASEEQGRLAIGDKDRQFDYLDPDDVQSENRVHGTPGAQVVAKVSPK